MAHKLIESFIDSFSFFGALPFYLFFSFFILFLGNLKLFIWLILGISFSYLFIMIIRLIYYKERPKIVEHKNILERIIASSFPSFHSCAITILSFLVCFYYKSTNLIVLFVIISFLVFFNRYHLRKHYLLDIIVGILLGFLVSGEIVLLFQ